MNPIVTAAEMQAIDRCAIEQFGIPGLTLMENAGRGVVRALEEQFPDLARKKVVICSGRGNNGGDGFVVARHLSTRAASVEVLLMGKRSDLKGDARENADIAINIGIPVRELDESTINSRDHSLRHCHIIVDALFGTGLTRPAEGIYQTIIQKINESEKFVVAVDLPSGIDSDTGQLMGPHVRADLTVALGLKKRSHILFPAAEAMGTVRVVDIGIPSKAVETRPVAVQEPEEKDITSWLPRRKRNSHKGNYGHVLVLAGSRGKAGAAGLTALAALRSGCGLVTLATPESCRRDLVPHILEVMTVPIPETENGCPHSSALDLLLEQCRGKEAVAIGPGISTDPQTILLLEKLLPKIQCPLVIDADGLNCISQSKGLLSNIETEMVLTPHPREMSRLCGKPTEEIQRDRIGMATRFARDHSVHLVLKGTCTITALPDGNVFVNPTGNPGMATGGSGDVLTGMLAGMIAQKIPIPHATVAGVYLHGLAGDHYSMENSETTLIAGDLLRTLPETLKKLLP